MIGIVTAFLQLKVVGRNPGGDPADDLIELGEFPDVGFPGLKPPLFGVIVLQAVQGEKKILPEAGIDIPVQQKKPCQESRIDAGGSGAHGMIRADRLLFPVEKKEINRGFSRVSTVRERSVIFFLPSVKKNVFL